MWLDHMDAQCVGYWDVNYFGMIRAIAIARAVVGYREHAVPVACWMWKLQIVNRLSTQLSLINKQDSTEQYNTHAHNII